ncbi:MAG: ankyrin repeat domain-containing protein [Armatimonadetes bacterium]|nr:ankyrin repeat domain-containing protein [Armatimonadota bacterium]
MRTSKFFEAIVMGDIASVRFLLEQDQSLTNETESGATPILTACYNGQIQIAELLRQYTPKLSIYEAAAMGDIHQLRDLVKTEPALLVTFSKDGFTPLSLACYFGHEQCVTYLLENRADPDVQSKNQLRVGALHSAVANGNVGIVEQVLERKADPNLRQQGGNTALHSAAQTNRLEIARLLLKHDAKPDIANDLGKTPHDLATTSGSKEVEMLLRAVNV